MEKDIEEKVKNSKLDIKGLNSVIDLSKRLLKIGYVMAIILTLYGLIIVGRESGVFAFIMTFLKIIAPLFIGVVIAWLFNPVVKWLTKKGLKRMLAAIIVYALLVGGLVLIVGALIPTLFNQIQDFAKVIPNLIDSVSEKASGLMKDLDKIEYINVESVKEIITDKVTTLGTDLSSNLPTAIINFLTSLFKGLGTFIVGLIIGFFFLISFDNTDGLIGFLPKKLQTNTKELMHSIDDALRSFVVGSVLDCTFIFIVSSIGLYFAGIKAPLLFGLFCGVTNIIPYAGPYIGGIPAVIVGFSQSITTGILTIVILWVIQFLEGNFLQPVILSKTTKLHPVTIILGLLVCGYFWGIFGMVISTPLLAAGKAILLYFDKKYDILKFN